MELRDCDEKGKLHDLVRKKALGDLERKSQPVDSLPDALTELPNESTAKQDTRSDSLQSKRRPFTGSARGTNA